MSSALKTTRKQPGDQTFSPMVPLLPKQSLPEEEQQRVLGEEKMLNINKKQATSPASKKPSQEGGKVGRGHDQAGPGGGGEAGLPVSTPWTPTLFAHLQGWLGEAQEARVSHVHLLGRKAAAAAGRAA